MPYYTSVIQPDEEVRYFGTLHWLIYTGAIIWGLGAIAAGAIALWIGRDPNLQTWYWIALIAAAFALLCAAAAFLHSWLQRRTTEIVITNKRVLYKTGWISRRTEEMNITKVETVDVRQTVPGRIFGYGTVLIRGIGSTWEPLERVTEPVKLRNAIIVG